MQREERFAEMQSVLSFLGPLTIHQTLPTLCSPYGIALDTYGFRPVKWAPFIWIGTKPLPKSHPLLTNHQVYSIGLSSALACLQLHVKPQDKVLDMCAAPGIKSLYLQHLHQGSLELFVNDISAGRLVRLKRLFTAFNAPLPTITCMPGQVLPSHYNSSRFDAVMIDAPCSGEGTILSGDSNALANWSPSKVRRLQQLQRKLVIAGERLLSTNGQLIYATCTLNRIENEGSLKKARIPVSSETLTKIESVALKIGESVRIMPSQRNIGFFIAKVR